MQYAFMVIDMQKAFHQKKQKTLLMMPVPLSLQPLRLTENIRFPSFGFRILIVRRES